MLHHFAVAGLTTLLIGIFALILGWAVRRYIPLLHRIYIPTAVIGAGLMALIIILLSIFFEAIVVLETRVRDAFLLVFLTSIGLSAKLSTIRHIGVPFATLCAVTVLTIIIKNDVGAFVSAIWGAHPGYGILVGSLSFVGGPGSAPAWVSELQNQGLTNAEAVATGAATLAVICGSLVAGPFTGWMVRRHKLGSTISSALSESILVRDTGGEGGGSASKHVDVYLFAFFVFALAVLAGETLNDWARRSGFVQPGFLVVVILGVVITNLADVFRYKLDLVSIERGGALALQLFLVIALTSTLLTSGASMLAPLVLNVALQIIVTMGIAYFVLFRLLGRDYDAALVSGGFLGVGVSSMPVTMAAMGEVRQRHGPSQKAFLLVALAGSFFVDAANAILAKVFLEFPTFQVVPSTAGG